MQRKETVHFIPGAGPGRGIGNVRRCLTLCAAMRGICRTKMYLPEWFPPLGDTRGVIRESVFGADATVGAGDVVVIDNQCPEEVEMLVSTVETAFPGTGVVLLDHEGGRSVEGALHINLRRCWDDGPPGFHQGFDYAIIRPEIVARRHRPPVVSERVERVLVTFGGEDPGKWTVRVVEWLEKSISWALNVDIVVGALSDREPVVARTTSPGRHEYRVHPQREDLEVLMAGCDFGFCGCGTTLMEFACLGKPVATLPQSDLERSFMRLFEDGGYLRPGIGDCVRKLEGGRLLAFIKDHGLRGEASGAGMDMIDGLGVGRIVNIIKACVEQ